MFLKIAMLYGLIWLGYIAQKRFSLHPEKISYALLYFILPGFIVSKLALSNITPIDLTKPLLVFLTAVGVCAICYFVSAKLWRKDDNKNMKYLTGASIPNANTGYFGIPLAILLFSDDLAALYILSNFGITLFQLTIGYYLYARSDMTFMKSIIRLLKFPSFWAMCIGLGVNFSHVVLPPILETELATVADITAFMFSIGGMMLIGVGLGDVKLEDINRKTLRILIWANVFCFILWPLVAILTVFLDAQFLHWLGEGEEKILWLMALCPIGANAVLYANNFQLYPKHAVLMVFSSTLLALPILCIAALAFLQ